jgi:hypothetical protein
MKTTPLTARKWFKHRNKASIIIAWAGFAILFLFLEWFLTTVPATLISMGVMLLVFYAFLNNWPIGFDCPHPGCGKYIESNHPWICGFKQCRNDNADDYPFVRECEHCHAKPKSYICHHCEKPIFLSKDKLNKNHARCTRPPKERDDLDISDLVKVERKAELELSIAGIDNELAKYGPKNEAERQRVEDMADLDHRISKIKKEAEFAREEAAAIKLAEANLPFEERADRDYERKMKRHRIADKGRALADERYPKDSIQHVRDMAHWKDFEEDTSIQM